MYIDKYCMNENFEAIQNLVRPYFPRMGSWLEEAVKYVFYNWINPTKARKKLRRQIRHHFQLQYTVLQYKSNLVSTSYSLCEGKVFCYKIFMCLCSYLTCYFCNDILFYKRNDEWKWKQKTSWDLIIVCQSHKTEQCQSITRDPMRCFPPCDKFLARIFQKIFQKIT